MSTDAVNLLRQRMIENIKCGQAPCWHVEGPYRQLQAVRRIFEAIPRHGYVGGHSPVPAVRCRDQREHLQRSRVVTGLDSCFA